MSFIVVFYKNIFSLKDICNLKLTCIQVKVMFIWQLISCGFRQEKVGGFRSLTQHAKRIMILLLPTGIFYTNYLSPSVAVDKLSLQTGNYFSKKKSIIAQSDCLYRSGRLEYSNALYLTCCSYIFVDHSNTSIVFISLFCLYYLVS